MCGPAQIQRRKGKLPVRLSQASVGHSVGNKTVTKIYDIKSCAKLEWQTVLRIPFSWKEAVTPFSFNIFEVVIHCVFISIAWVVELSVWKKKSIQVHQARGRTRSALKSKLSKKAGENMVRLCSLTSTISFGQEVGPQPHSSTQHLQDPTAALLLILLPSSPRATGNLTSSSLHH